MLAQPTRRQHIVSQHYTPTIPSPPSQHLAYQQIPHQQFATQQQLFDQKLLHDYLESQQQSYNTPTINAPNSFMTSAYTDFANPAIRIQQSTPTPQSLSNGYQPSMLSSSTTSTGLDGWNTYGNVQGQSLQTPVHNQNRGHQRASSSSSVGSSTSQYQSVAPAASYQSFSNHLPTPSHTPTQDSFMGQNTFNNYAQNNSNMDQTMAAHMSMKQALMDQGDDVPEFAHSARQSVSSYDSPATPHTTLDESDTKMTTNETRQQPIVPKFERTYTDIAADNFYDPNAVTAPPAQQSKPAQSSLLSPYRSNATENVQRALQAAQYARSHSPCSTTSRGDSPFRKGSPYHQPNHSFNSPMLGTAAATREQNRQADAAYAMKPQMRTEDSVVKTISPKDALLDYREDEDSKMPLFPDGSANDYSSQYNSGDQYRSADQSSFDTAQSYRRDSWATPQFASNFSTSTAPSLPTTTSFNFVTPAIQNSMTTMPMAATSQYRSTPMTSTVDQTPEFPTHPHLTSMESSASEADPPNGSQSSVEQFLRKPVSSAADSGTYSCTYHGCSQRFETPQKLQKHKREGHRNANNLGPSMTSAAILDCNTQAGPHKCERTNPTTGKPCNTIFSRPYDLTRHEDTIHNARKQKVRCALCVEEKTFSRNDALTRHMRVVHPEVDFPGKHRRRGGSD